MRRILSLLIMVVVTVSVSAFDFRPISRDFDPQGPGALQTFRVTNNRDSRIAVRISMFEREMEADGSEERTRVEDRFVVFPSRLTLDPGQTQVIRVQWRGGSVDTEEAYRIVAEQLPVDFEERAAEGGTLNILFRYVGSVYVVPPDAEPNVTVEEARVVDAGEAGATLELTMHNAGTAHTILKDLALTVTQTRENNATQRAAFAPEELSPVAGSNLLAGARRNLTLQLPGEWQEGPAEVSLDFDVTR